MSYAKTKLMNLEDGQTLLGAIDGKMSDLKSALHDNLHLIATGTYSKGVTVFTSSDVNVGDKIKWRVGGDAGYIGDIELYDANDTFKGAIGKTTNGDSPTMFEGTWTVPSWFAYAKTYSTGTGKPIYISYLYNKIVEEHLSAIDDKIEENNNFALQELNKAFGYNLIGNVASTDYPVLIHPGEKITFSRQDGNIFPTDSTLEVSFKGKTKNTLVGWSLKNGETSKTWTNGTTSDIYYMSINEVSTSPLMANYGATAMPYQVYISDTLENRINGNEKNINTIAAINSEFQKFAIGEKINNEVLFTSDDAAPGNVLYFDFTSPVGATTGYIEFRDSSNNVVNFYLYPTDKYEYNQTTAKSFWGRDTADRTPDYKGRLIVPSGFSICRVKANGTNVVVFRELYIDKNEYRLKSLGLEIPPYYFVGNYLPAKVLAINNRLEENMAYGDSFIFLTDAHVSSNQFKSPALIQYIRKNTCIDKFIFGGDLLNGGQTYEYISSRGFMNLIREGFGRSIHFVVGNHDVFGNNLTSHITTWGDALIENYNGNSPHHYYYFDNKRAKIRYIILCNYYETETPNVSNGIYADVEQQNWFRNVALDLDEGWGAIVITHDCYYFTFTTTKEFVFDPQNGAVICGICDQYNADENSKGEIIAIVQGHTHVDRVLRTTGGIPIIMTTADQNMASYGDTPSIVLPDGVDPRATGTIREQAFDVMVIDRRKDANNKGTIYAIRVGCEAYDGTGPTMADFGSATQERIVKFNTKFDATDWG